MELSEKARELKNDYQRIWRQKNREKIRQAAIRYWNKKADSFNPAEAAKELSHQGFTQRQIAEQLNISVGTVNKILNGA
jgi:DNA-binding NarL/FixJ family response regulator